MSYTPLTTSLRPKARPETLTESPRPQSRSQGLASREVAKEPEEEKGFWDYFDFFGGSTPDDDTTSPSDRASKLYERDDMQEALEARPGYRASPVEMLRDSYVGAVGEAFTPEYPGDVPEEIKQVKAITPPPVTTTELGPDMNTLSEQDAQEQAAVRSVSGTTEALGRVAPTGLMSPPVQDTVPEVDTDTAEAVVEEEETTTTTPTRDELIDSVFEAEGGYSTDVNDTGNYYRGQFVGTNHGISAPVLADHLGRTPTVEDMRGLSQATAREIAATKYYDAYNISDLPDDIQEIVFHAVYMGGSRGVRAVQNLTGSTPDGVMGPNTRTAMQEATFTPQEYRDEYLRELEFGTTGYSNPSNTWDTHGRGWTNRYNDLAGN